MNPKLRDMQLIPKDLELLRYLHKVKVASYDQILRDIYSGYHPSSASRRIRQLENNRLIIGSRCRMLASGQRLMSITKYGFDRFVARGDEKCAELKSDAPLHDLALGDLRHMFMKSSKTRLYLTENELQTWGYLEPEAEFKDAIALRSDALMIYQFPRNALVFAIEYECSQKADKRYEEKVKKYYAKDIPLILFVSDQPSILSKVQRIEASLYQGEHPRFFYQLLDRLKQSEVPTFENLKRFSLAFGL